MSDRKPPKKCDRILAGLRRLCEEQPPGRAYTTVEIAQHCDCSPENIGQIERKALENVRSKIRRVLHEHDAPVLRVKKGGANASQ